MSHHNQHPSSLPSRSSPFSWSSASGRVLQNRRPCSFIHGTVISFPSFSDVARSHSFTLLPVELAATFRGIMRTPSPFQLFRLVANALNPIGTYGHFMEWLSTIRRDTHFPWTAATITDPISAFIEWLSSQVNPLLQWVAD